MTELSINTDLIVVAHPDALEVFTTPARVDEILALVRKRIDAFGPAPPADTVEGRNVIVSRAFAITRSKTAIGAVGDMLARDAKELPKKIDAGRKRFKDTLEQWADEIRKPVSDWEARDEERRNKHVNAIERVREKQRIAESGRLAVEVLETMRREVEEGKLPADKCEEFFEGYRTAEQSALAAISLAIVERKKLDDDAAELARLRALETIEREAAERKKRLDTEAAALPPSAAQKAIDTANVQLIRSVNRGAVQALMRTVGVSHDLSEEQARAVVIAIARKQIPNVSITY